MARPPKKVDPELVRKLAEKLWSTEHIAEMVGCSARTLSRRFADILCESRLNGKSKLIDHLWARATGGKTQNGVFIPASDKLLIHALNRFLGPIPQKIQITKEQAIEFLEKELEREGTDPEPSDES